MSDKFYSYSDSNNDELNVYRDPKGTVIGTTDATNIPQEELPKLIAVLQSHLGEPTDHRPWVVVTQAHHIIGPFTSNSEARKRMNEGELVRQVVPPEPDIDHEWATEIARDTLSSPNNPKSCENLARAYLELSAKQ